MTMAIQSMSAILGSPEEMCSALDDSLWEIDFRQLEAGSAPVTIDALVTASSMLMKTEIGGRVHQVAAMDKDYITFGLPSQASAPVKIGSVVGERDTLTRFDTAGGVDGVSEAGFSAYTASFRRSGLEQLAESLGFDFPESALSGDARHLYLSSGLARQMRCTMEQMLTTQTSDQLAAGGRGLARELDVDLASQLLTICQSGGREYSTSASNRTRVLRRALDYIESNPRVAVGVEQLCRESACSISTLERAFREHFGVSPKRYLTAVRLSGVRKTLLASADQTVGDVSADWGFWHPSKLAADYRRMFGELPSQTLRAA